MRRLPSVLLPIAGLALACSVEEPTGPTGSGQPTAEQRPAGTTDAALTTITFIDQAGSVGWYTSLVSGGDGRQHITYQDRSNFDLKYATCASGCGSSSNWTKGFIDQTGSVGQHSSLEVGSNGRRHVAYRDETNQDLKFATCAPTADCSLAASWTKARVDTQDDAGLATGLTLGADGRRHVSYLRRQMAGAGQSMALLYATCSSACGQAANWIKVTVDEGPDATAVTEDFLGTSIAIGRNGRRHISYLNSAGSDLRYATCLSGCDQAANWQKVTVDAGAVQIGFNSSLAVGPDGAVHIGYLNSTNADLKYARCASDCAKASNWTKLPVAASGFVGAFPSLALDASGRIHISYHDWGIEALSYATCKGGCLSPLGWSRQVLDDNGQSVGQFTSLTARDGVVRISYYDDGNDDLKFLTSAPLVNPF